MAVPEQVRRLALNPFAELPRPPEVELFELDGAVLAISPWPTAQIVRPIGKGPSDVAGVVEAARVVARKRGKRVIGWWIVDGHDHLAAALEAAGLENRDTPGFEAVENGMALVSPPSGRPADDVEVGVVESWEQYAATAELTRAVFGMPEMSEQELRKRHAEYAAGVERGLTLFAAIDGHVVGACYAAFGAAGINLFGAGVDPQARSRGVYRSLVLARWQLAVERGTPALTVQAGRMAQPICERLGFVFVGAVRVFVDEIAD